MPSRPLRHSRTSTVVTVASLTDPTLAAYLFAGPVMYQPMNQLTFAGTDALPPAGKLSRIADSAVEMFLTTYG
jgi:TetR/AcrR family transcriptional regulator, mexJK operon transcriptional repressor